MRREPPSRQRRVALACVHVDCVIRVFTISVNDVFTVESLVFLKWIVRTKSVGIDGERLLLTVSQQEPNRRLVCGFRWYEVPLLGATIYEDENGWFVLFIRPAPTSREAARARSAVALAAFQAGRDVELINFDWSDEIE